MASFQPAEPLWKTSALPPRGTLNCGTPARMVRPSALIARALPKIVVPCRLAAQAEPRLVAPPSVEMKHVHGTRAYLAVDAVVIATYRGGVSGGAQRDRESKPSFFFAFCPRFNSLGLPQWPPAKRNTSTAPCHFPLILRP